MSPKEGSVEIRESRDGKPPLSDAQSSPTPDERVGNMSQQKKSSWNPPRIARWGYPPRGMWRLAQKDKNEGRRSARDKKPGVRAIGPIEKKTGRDIKICAPLEIDRDDLESGGDTSDDAPIPG